MEQENTIWEGCPSQWTNALFYICCIPLVLVYGFGLLLALWKFVDTINNNILITDQRIIEKRGILSKITKELELYRVKDIQHREPLFLRIFGLSNIVLTTTDHDSTVQVIKGIETGNEIKEKLRIAIDVRRDLKRVREIDLN
jgi:uncharacterized membrane protein YdbT with pleckstrin-like domain